MEGGAIVYIALFFSFVIGLIFGGLAAFLSRRMLFNRQMRFAERKAAKMVAEPEMNLRKCCRKPRTNPNVLRLRLITSTVNAGANCRNRKTV